MQKRLLTFVEDFYEDLELWYPKLRLEEEGFGLTLAAPALKIYRGKHGYPATADALIAEVKCLDFCGLLIPGGFMPDKLRRDGRVLALTREFHEQGKLVAFICHGGWIPISANILHGKRATGSLGIKDDLENAGATWVDEPVVLDGNLLSSRTPLDLPHFARAMVEFLSPVPVTAAHPAAPLLATQAKPGAAPQEHLEGVFKLNPSLVKKISH
ncbi:MAG: type 1 glutamine amidotransferase [Verrucomicrobia bacterium]|nr:type 1 glutamine amidotransferase [Verrucomicrobiota bacterium]